MCSGRIRDFQIPERNRYHGVEFCGRSCICTCESAQNTRYAMMKFEGGYGASQRRKIQSKGKRKLSIRDAVAYMVTSVHVFYVTTKEWIIGIYGNFFSGTIYENVSSRRTLCHRFIYAFQYSYSN